jgi:tRNA-specific 2-thiouridylase
VRVVAAMSGGVDSAVAAALLKEQGYDVVGVTMRLYDEGQGRGSSEAGSRELGVNSDGEGSRGCCGGEGIRSAARAAAALGIPHYAWDFRDTFEREVIADFCSEYGRGRTPNPCLRCNSLVKFRYLLGRAQGLNAAVVATGHYARIVRDATGRWHLLRAVDASRDQSYFLYEMTQEQLGRVMMPLGGLCKSEVREWARRLGLPVAERPDSQEICFVPDDDYAGFLRRRRPELFRPGPVVDTAGRRLGGHQGLAAFTIGQRKGLGIALGERMYVVRLDAEVNTVVLGRDEDCRHRVVEAGTLTWVAGAAPGTPCRVQARVRSQGQGSEVTLGALGPDRARVVFDEPQWAPTPGQAVVFWNGDEVLGGGTIEESRRE